MATGEEKSAGADLVGGQVDLYAVLGLKKECSEAELKNAYKKLALRWHPDRCTAAGNSKCIQESKEKFQQIQGAYAVLSDSSKRFLYDVGAYDSDDEDHDGMGEFLGEMAEMMSQIKPDNKQESFEELQQLFVEMFQTDLGSGFCGSQMTVDMASSSSSSSSSPSPPPSFSSTFSFQFCNGGANGSNKRSCSDSNQTKSGFEMLKAATGTFCFGTSEMGNNKGRGSCNGKRRSGRKQH
ncbi:Chaperone protein DnaJ [Rhynchospora pubera]|uniref:Chaperone protein DnaJ n=1 Tax=Rhynchospora pubera TaxID=906938 RepID=A0AAV8CJ63_9POAL|nr:Chaperone protein DnaJ [Rhynchospora pubera]